MGRLTPEERRRMFLAESSRAGEIPDTPGRKEADGNCIPDPPAL